MSTRETRPRHSGYPGTALDSDSRSWVLGIQARLQDAEFVELTTVAVEQDPVAGARQVADFQTVDATRKRKCSVTRLRRACIRKTWLKLYGPTRPIA